ncbi:MAG: undecaprenyl-diphosphate phosphatase [Saprospiraceae bacterium]
MSLWQAIVLAIIEGLTEFLPVSSTGHIILGSATMGIASDPFVKVFTVAIQFGAILSVVTLYWRKFFRSVRFYVLLFVAFIPAAVMGLLFKSYIDALLENIAAVAIALILGGVVFLWIDGWFRSRIGLEDSTDQITYKQALNIGFFQTISMIPGVSRSAATIIGGLTQGYSPRTAAEFSFFLAVPTMFAATVKSLYDHIKVAGAQFGPSEWQALAVGNIVAYIVAMLAIRSFIGYLGRHGFKIFGYYRIALGILVLLLWYLDFFKDTPVL